MLGCKFEQLAKIIEGVEDKSRVGVCLDTCQNQLKHLLCCQKLIVSQATSSHRYFSRSLRNPPSIPLTIHPGLRYSYGRSLRVSADAVSLSVLDKFANEKTLIHRPCSATSMSAIASVWRGGHLICLHSGQIWRSRRVLILARAPPK